MIRPLILAAAMAAALPAMAGAQMIGLDPVPKPAPAPAAPAKPPSPEYKSQLRRELARQKARRAAKRSFEAAAFAGQMQQAEVLGAHLDSMAAQAAAQDAARIAATSRASLAGGMAPPPPRSPVVQSVGHYCGATTLGGTPCRNWVVNGFHCYLHGG